MDYGIKISINSESYGITRAPILTRALFNWFWCNFWKVRNGTYYHDETFIVKSIDIRINQALSYMPYHFYVTINGDLEYHIAVDVKDIEDWKSFPTKGFSRKTAFEKNVVCNMIKHGEKAINLLT